MKIYTKTGDRGTTSLVGGERVLKTDERVEAYGTVDELIAFTAALGDRMRDDETLSDFVNDIDRINSRLMTAAALLATGEGGSDKVPPLPEGAVAELEHRIDEMQAELEPITRFTIPGGHPTVSACHICRTVCRRAERATLRADALRAVEPSVLAFLNRLSDYFYTLGRRLNVRFGVEEILWIP